LQQVEAGFWFLGAKEAGDYFYPADSLNYFVTEAWAIYYLTETLLHERIGLEKMRDKARKTMGKCKIALLTGELSRTNKYGNTEHKKLTPEMREELEKHLATAIQTIEKSNLNIPKKETARIANGRRWKLLVNNPAEFESVLRVELEKQSTERYRKMVQNQNAVRRVSDALPV